MVLFATCFNVNFCAVFTTVCLDGITCNFGYGSRMATFLERAYRSPVVICLFAILVISHFGFSERDLILTVPVPGHCFKVPLTFNRG